jgi:2,4-didehydro-3-deoxy-L-rhamnonate hydrolase
VRIVNVSGRLVLVDASGAGLDVEKASDGRFPGDPQAIFAQWDEFRDWAAGGGGRGRPRRLRR